MKPDASSIRIFRGKLLKWFACHERDYPWRRARDPWRVLIAEMMLQRTKADQVERVYRDFFRKFKKPSDAAGADPALFRATLFPLGLRWRIENFRAIARDLTLRFKGHVPSTREELRSLPGVGDYVAGAVLSVAFNQPEWIVDTSVVRVFRRFFGIRTSKEGRRDRHVIEMAKVYSNCVAPREANLALLDFAALVCIPRKPLCEICPIRRRCVYFNDTAGSNSLHPALEIFKSPRDVGCH